MQLTDKEARDQYREMQNHRPKMPQPGDVICAMGYKFEIDKLLSTAECYVEWNDKAGSYEYHWFVEFLDPNGGYHYWKSAYDGGYIGYKLTDAELKKIEEDQI